MSFGDIPDLVSANDLARRWGVSHTTVARIAERAGIRSVYLGGASRGTRRFRMDDVLRYELKVTK